MFQFFLSKLPNFWIRKYGMHLVIVNVCDVDFQKSHVQNYKHVPYTAVVSNIRL